MIYFAENEKSDEIKIGYSETVSNRIKQHGFYGFKPICALPGGEADEDRLHNYFEEFRCRGNDYYHRADIILDYCARLIEKQFAHPDPEIGKQLPDLPYSAWGPEFLKDNAIEVDGQTTIFPMLPAANRLKIISRQAQNHSFTDEWYTPQDLIDLVLLLFLTIDTDPATSIPVNLKFIKAKTFYTKHTNGLDLSRPWFGNVWLNPPYGKGEGSAGQFVKRLCDEFEKKNIRQAISCLNAASMTSKWFYSTVPRLVAAHCVVNGRPNFMPPEGKSNSSPNKGIVLSYFGDQVEGFCEIFGAIGQILVPMARIES